MYCIVHILIKEHLNDHLCTVFYIFSLEGTSGSLMYCIVHILIKEHLSELIVCFHVFIGRKTSLRINVFSSIDTSENT
jgi:hypothetical protein